MGSRVRRAEERRRFQTERAREGSRVKSSLQGEALRRSHGDIELDCQLKPRIETMESQNLARKLFALRKHIVFLFVKVLHCSRRYTLYITSYL